MSRTHVNNSRSQEQRTISDHRMGGSVHLACAAPGMICGTATAAKLAPDSCSNCRFETLSAPIGCSFARTAFVMAFHRSNTYCLSLSGPNSRASVAKPTCLACDACRSPRNPCGRHEWLRRSLQNVSISEFTWFIRAKTYICSIGMKGESFSAHQRRLAAFQQGSSHGG